jgi:RNA 2',3'-cyclic 3'-phosphodiesterase
MDLPDAARVELAEWRAEAFAGREEVRLVAPEALHVTLVFLGYKPEKEIPRIGELMRASVPAGEPPELVATGVKPVPPRRPRLFALDLEDDAGRAVAVQAALSDAFEAEKLYVPEKRPFWPHVTLARVKRGARAEPLEAPPPPADAWRADAVTLYRSTLLPQGARYDALERVPLADPAGS